MATDYDITPNLVERVLAADLIVVGANARLIDLQPDRTERTGRVLGLFEVDGDEILKGDPPERLLVRALLLLARDVQPDQPNEVYGPVFGSVYALADGSLDLPPEIIDDGTRDILRCLAQDTPPYVCSTVRYAPHHAP